MFSESGKLENPGHRLVLITVGHVDTTSHKSIVSDPVKPAPTGLIWSGLVWSGLVWPGLAWPGLAWPGLAWPGLAWPGLAWPGLAWPGLAWPGLAWPGLAWPGLAWSGTTSSVSQPSHGRLLGLGSVVERAETVAGRPTEAGPGVHVAARRADGNGRVGRRRHGQSVDAAIVPEVLIAQDIIERRPRHDVGDLVLQPRRLAVVGRGRRRRVVPARPTRVCPRRVVPGRRAEIAVEVARRLIRRRRQVVERGTRSPGAVGVQLELIDGVGAGRGEGDAGDIEAAVVGGAERRSAGPLEAHVVRHEGRPVRHDGLAAGAEGGAQGVAPLEVLRLAHAGLADGAAHEDDDDEEDAADHGQGDDDGAPVERRRHVRV